jgi:hypothetical protein
LLINMEVVKEETAEDDSSAFGEPFGVPRSAVRPPSITSTSPASNGSTDCSASELGLVKAVIPHADQDSEARRARGIGVVFKAHRDETFGTESETNQLTLRHEWCRGRFHGSEVQVRYRFVLLGQEAVGGQLSGNVEPSLRESSLLPLRGTRCGIGPAARLFICRRDHAVACWVAARNSSIATFVSL